MSVMLYKHPGPHHFPQHGGYFDYVVVAEGEVNARLADGWHRTCEQALNPLPPSADMGDAPPTDEPIAPDRLVALNLRDRAATALAEANLVYVDEVREKTDAELLALPGLGPAGVTEIRAAIERFDSVDEI